VSDTPRLQYYDDFYEANCFLYIFRVEVDCQQIFLPGQLGVAIGRCTSVDGLRIINFKDEVCLPHPETVELF
jgi:hypothetical protein